MRALLLVLFLLWPAVLSAQDQAALVADRVAITGSDVMIAEGNVEVFYQGRRLRAQRVVYDAAADRLTIDGPITLTDPDGTAVLADQAELSADLTEGLLISARLVFNQQLQLAASEILRVGDRYTRLGQTVASSCKVCAGSPTPLWEIRARRVVHDQEARQIYFDGAQLRFGGVPVAFIPRLRMPDPTLKRSSGFMLAEFRSSSGLGSGIKVPYFIVLGPSRDLTVTPYVTTEGGRSLDLRYRQAFRTGTITLSAATSRDRILPGKARGYAEAEGDFVLPRGFRLTFSGQTVSDRGYLRDYGLDDTDRLDSRIAITRTTADEYLSARLIHFYSIREGEVNARLPSLIGDLTWQRRFRPEGIGGVAGLTFQTHARQRAATDGADTDGDGIGDGRDTARASARLAWRRDAVFGPGLLGAALVDVAAEVFDTRQDDSFGGTRMRLSGGAAVELRWPLTRATGGGATQVIEPVVQLVWAGEDEDGAIPNEDSVLAEFDEGNLFAFDRLPGADAVERGPRANLGLSFTHYAPAGWTAAVTLGRVFRAEDARDFSAASGLSGTRSDWLAAFRLGGGGGLSLTNRLVLDDGFGLTKGEVRLDYQQTRYGLASSYIWMLADPVEDRDVPVSELVLDGRYQINPTWSSRFSARYDFTADRAAEAALKMEWRNECLKVDLSLSRRFTSSTSVRATTDVGLSVELLGFGGTSQPGPARACRG